MTIITVLTSMAIVLTGAQVQAQSSSSHSPIQNVRPSPAHSPTLQKASDEGRIVPAHPTGIQNEAFINPNLGMVFVPTMAGSAQLQLIPTYERVFINQQENPY